jgi:diadenosine tetraphosphate (Ap4A) HIT family hydrolase
MTESTFEQRKAGVNCPMCPDSQRDNVVAELPSGFVHLQNDADYRGYCILIFRRHAVELFDLTPEERHQWADDIARVGQAVETVCAPDKLNVSMLGNMVPHLHCHLMPRYPTDPEWGGPPAFRSQDERHILPPQEYESLRESLRDALNAS